MNSANLMFELFKRPEYVHVLINPLPLYGLAMAILSLAIGLLARSRPAQVLALWLVLLSRTFATGGEIRKFFEVWGASFLRI